MTQGRAGAGTDDRSSIARDPAPFPEYHGQTVALTAPRCSTMAVPNSRPSC